MRRFPLYAGSLAAMPTLRLGAFAPGEAHTYAFTVTLPAAAPGGADINAYQSSSLQVGYAWTSTGEAPPVADPARPRTTPSPAPPRSSPPSGTPSTPNASGPGPGPSAAPSPGRPSPSALSAPGPSSGADASAHGSSHRGVAGGASGATGRSATGGAGTGSIAAGGAIPGGNPSAPDTGSPAERGSRSGRAARHHARPSRHASGGTAGSKPHHPSESPLSGLLSAIGGVASAIVEHGAFPFALLLLMLAFFYAQYRLDRRDPKLALAPVDPEPARSFE